MVGLIVGGGEAGMEWPVVSSPGNGQNVPAKFHFGPTHDFRILTQTHGGSQGRNERSGD
jgi:hypothetical protein